MRRPVLISVALVASAGIVVLYVVVSILVTQSLTRAERNPQVARPRDHRL